MFASGQCNGCLLRPMEYSALVTADRELRMLQQVCEARSLCTSCLHGHLRWSRITYCTRSNSSRNQREGRLQSDDSELMTKLVYFGGTSQHLAKGNGAKQHRWTRRTKIFKKRIGGSVHTEATENAFTGARGADTSAGAQE